MWDDTLIMRKHQAHEGLGKSNPYGRNNKSKGPEVRTSLMGSRSK